VTGSDETFSWGDRRAGALIGLGFALLYLSTATRHMLGGDAGEFAVVGATGGYAHPPGYPVYSLYLALFGRLPLSTPAHEAALATGLLGAAAVGLLYLALRAWHASRFGALLATLVFGLAAEIWLLHTIPEAFALNHLVAAATLYVAGPSGPLRGRGRMVALGACAALGVAHHHTIIFLLPVGLYGVWRAVDESEDHPAASLAGGLAVALVGLLAYGYLVWVTRMVPDAFHWAEVEAWSDLVRIFFRREYGTFALTTEDGHGVSALTQWSTLATEASADLLYLPVLLGLVGFASPFVGRLDGAERFGRRGSAALIAAWILCGPVFVALIGRGVSGADYLHLRKFHALFELMTVVGCAFGATLLERHISRRSLALLLVAGVILAGGARALPFRQDYTGPTLEQYVRDTLEPLPEDAILVGDSDHRYFGFAYGQRALGLRRDVDYIDTQILGFEWYRDRVESQLGFKTGATDQQTHIGRLFERVRQSGRPLFVTHRFHPEMEKYWRLEPVGTAFRLLPPDAEGTPPAEQFARQLDRLEQAHIAPRPWVPKTSWNHLVLTHYGLVWQFSARQLGEAGHQDRARHARSISEKFAPWLWK
jgi:hypothetical protein